MRGFTKKDKTRPYSSAEHAQLVFSGRDYFQRLEKIIAGTRNELHIHTYIFDQDETGNAVIEQLKKAAERKVKIYLLLDSFGASSFPDHLEQELAAAGINIRFFAPFLSTDSFYFGRRLHHKVIVADRKIALIGGINIADKYRGTSEQLPWLDYAVEIRGTICSGIQDFCSNIYHKKVNRAITESNQYQNGSVPVRIALNDWLSRKNQISRGYLDAIRNAKEEIIIVGGYFIPGRRLRNELKEASKRGVKVKIILAGISDVPLVARATRFFYSFLLRYEIELHEWRHSVLHGKAAVVDKEWCTIGSFNLNHLSTYASIEMNVEIHSKEFCSLFTNHLYEVMSRCMAVSRVKYENKNLWLNKLSNWAAFRLIRIFSFILTVFSYHRLFSKYFLIRGGRTR
ncbi:MAG TPA: phospholipase D-like domain-containing protein [Bacteroidia bacterium]|jgi:cardiolipin synthase